MLVFPYVEVRQPEPRKRLPARLAGGLRDGSVRPVSHEEDKVQITFDVTHATLARIQQTAVAIRRRENELFAAGSGLVALHAVDVRAWVPLLLVAALAALYRLLPASARAALAASVAPLAALTGVLNVLDAR
jgi:hypothetical protein